MKRFYFYTMHSFIDSVVKEVISSQKRISKCTFILPSKRAGLFLKQSLKTNLNAPSILPEIYSIEEFIEELSKIKIIDNIESLFEFYNIYKGLTPSKNWSLTVDSRIGLQLFYRTLMKLIGI